MSSTSSDSSSSSSNSSSSSSSSSTSSSRSTSNVSSVSVTKNVSTTSVKKNPITVAADLAADGPVVLPTAAKEDKLVVEAGSGFVDLLGTGSILRRLIKRIAPKAGIKNEDLPAVEMGDEIILHYSVFVMNNKNHVMTKEVDTENATAATTTTTTQGKAKNATQYVLVSKSVTTKIRIGSGDVIPVLEYGARMMQKGDVCEIQCISRFGYDDIGLSADVNDHAVDKIDILPGARLRVHLELRQIVGKAIPEENMTMGQMMAEATKKKNHGNLFFKQRHYARSARSYATAIQLMSKIQKEDAEPLPQPLVVAGRSLIISLGNNLANSQFKLQQYKDSINSSSNVLGLDPDNIKALYRFSLATHAIDDVESSIAALKKALTVEPENRDIKAQMVKVLERAQEIKAKEKKLYGNILERMHSADDVLPEDEIDESTFKVIKSEKKWKMTNYDSIALGVLIVLIAIFFRVVYFH